MSVSLPSPASFEDFIPEEINDKYTRRKSFPSITHLDSSSGGSVEEKEIGEGDGEASSSFTLYDTDES